MRNWSAVLIDAGLRGLTMAEVARELGVPHAQVSSACKRYGVALCEGHSDRGKKAYTRAAAKWAVIFRRATPGATLNQFCKHYKCSYSTAERWAREFGYVFAPARKART